MRPFESLAFALLFVSLALFLVPAIDGQRMLAIMNAYVPAFFDHHLLGERAELLERNSAEYSEVELESRNTGS